MTQCPFGAVFYRINPGDTLFLIARMYNTTVSEILSANPGIDPYNLYIGQVLCLYPGHAYSTVGEYPTSNEMSGTQVDLSNYIRMLWEQHVVWTRLAILSMVFDLPDVDLVTNRLLRNPKDFETLLKPLYGDMIASRFSDLLTSHLEIAAELIKAAKAGDNKAAEDAEKRWYENADEIASFLASINPYWSEEDWRTMLYEHLALTKNEAVDMLTGKYEESIATFDEIEKQALEMADMMTRGIIRQFPDLFN